MAVELFKYMEKHGCIPNIVTYNTVINCLCKEKKVDHALDLLSEMSFKGRTHDVMTCTLVIQSLYNLKRWGDVKRLLFQMPMRKIQKPMRKITQDMCIYNGYCLRDQVDKAVAILNTVKSIGIVPDCSIYNYLINGYCRTQRVDKAIDLFRKMSAEGFKPVVETYDTLIHGLVRMGRHVEARKLFYQMLNEGNKLNTITCGIFLDGLCKNYYFDEAMS